MMECNFKRKDGSMYVGCYLKKGNGDFFGQCDEENCILMKIFKSTDKEGQKNNKRGNDA
jgi:hypothetical protein